MVAGDKPVLSDRRMHRTGLVVGLAAVSVVAGVVFLPVFFIPALAVGMLVGGVLSFRGSPRPASRAVAVGVMACGFTLALLVLLGIFSLTVGSHVSSGFGDGGPAPAPALREAH